MFYEASVEDIANSLEKSWSHLGLKATLHSWSPTYWKYDHPSGIRSVLTTIEKLQGRYLP